MSGPPAVAKGPIASMAAAPNAVGDPKAIAAQGPIASMAMAPNAIGDPKTSTDAMLVQDSPAGRAKRHRQQHEENAGKPVMIKTAHDRTLGCELRELPSD